MNEDAPQDLNFDEWSGAQQADEDAQRQRVRDAWQRIKNGLYMDRDSAIIERDIDIIEYELRAVL